MAASLSSRQTPPADDWPTATPEDSGFAPGMAEKLDRLVANGSLKNLHAVVVVRRGKLVLERYYAGLDEHWGRPLGEVTFDASTAHDLRSVSKSIVGLLYGIALAEGKVPPPDAPLLEQFPDYADLADDLLRKRMTVDNALTMQMGTAWDESLSYADPRNSERAMELAEDRYRFVLDRPMLAEPGGQWVYNGGATAVIAKLISLGTGRELLDFAQEKLFAPLGITRVEWVKGSDGEYVAASGLRLRPRDLAKIGQLALNRGQWDGRQVVPADWLTASFTPHAKADEELSYGYQWWLGVHEGRVRWVSGFGNGGQRLYCNPGLDLVLVVTAGNYNQPDAWQIPVAIILEVILPALGIE